MDRLVVDTIEVLQSTLINLIAGQVVYITADDFENLTGDKITAFASEGRFMLGNLCARANCTIVTTTDRLIFTKNPACNSPTLTYSRGSVPFQYCAHFWAIGDGKYTLPAVHASPVGATAGSALARASNREYG